MSAKRVRLIDHYTLCTHFLFFRSSSQSIYPLIAFKFGQTIYWLKNHSKLTNLICGRWFIFDVCWHFGVTSMLVFSNSSIDLHRFENYVVVSVVLRTIIENLVSAFCISLRSPITIQATTTKTIWMSWIILFVMASNAVYLKMFFINNDTWSNFICLYCRIEKLNLSLTANWFQEWMDFHENCQTVRRFIGIFLLAIHSVGIYKFVQ